MLSIHTLSHDAESYLMSRATFAWSGAVQAELREESTEVIFLSPLSPSVSALLSLCISLSASLLWSSPPPHPSLPFSPSSSHCLSLSTPLNLSLFPSAVSEFPRVRQRETITLTDGFALLQFLSVLFLPALPLFHHPSLLLLLLCSQAYPPALLFITSTVHECVCLCVFLCTHAQVFQPSPPPPPPPASLLPFLFLLLLFFSQYNWHRRRAPCRVC